MKNNFLSLYYNESNSHIFVNGTKKYQFNAKDSEITAYPLCLGNISKEFSVNNMEQTRPNWYVYDLAVDYFSTDVGAIQDIHKI